jgi:ribosome-associated translation inhibitor RaiA
MPDHVVYSPGAEDPMDVPVEIVVHGDVGPTITAYARDKVARVTRFVSDPILDARVTLRVAGDPARERPAIAKGSLDIDGTLVRAHVAAHGLREAIDLLEERLRDRVEHVAQRRQALRKRGPRALQPHEWRHGDAPTHRPPYFDRPPEDREVVRRKTFALHGLSPAEAAEEMDRLDYDFHLFVCADTKTPCVVSRRPDGRVGIASTGPLPPAQDWLVPESAPTPTLAEDDAVALLNLSGVPFVFYRDAASGAGVVIYRRYDGHYGLITSNSARPPTRSLTAATA